MIGFTFLMSGSFFPSSVCKGSPFFFEKTNKITTNYQILELSDPWRPYKPCYPKRNFDFWRKLLKALNTPIYIGCLLAPFALFGPVRGIAGLPDEDHPERGQEMPLPGSLTPCNHRHHQSRHHQRTGQEHHHHRQPPATTGNHFQRLQPEITTTRDPKVI